MNLKGYPTISIELEMNPKEPELMRKLNKGLYVLNEMDGQAVQFKV